MDQERLSSLAMCNMERKTANKVLNNDTELLINKFAGKHGRNRHFSDQMLMYILIFDLLYLQYENQLTLYVPSLVRH